MADGPLRPGERDVQLPRTGLQPGAGAVDRAGPDGGGLHRRVESLSADGWGNPVGLRDPLGTDPFNDMWNDENAVWTDKTEYDDAGNAVETHVSIQQPDPGADPADSSPSYPDDPSAGQLLKQGAEYNSEPTDRRPSCRTEGHARSRSVALCPWQQRGEIHLASGLGALLQSSASNGSAIPDESCSRRIRVEHAGRGDRGSCRC